VKLPRPNLKTPKVKAPKIKLPPAVGAMVDNLRERGLLPVAVVLVVAILAVPFLLSGGSQSPAPNPKPAAAATAGALQTQQAVVLANDPGIRDYKKRLNGPPKDPFKQQFAAPTSGGGNASTGVTQTGGASSAGTSGAPPSGGTPSGTSSGKPSSAPVPGAGVYYYAADMYVGVAGKKMKLWKNVKHGASLPNDNVRAAVFISVPIDKPGVAQFVISSAVVDIGGDGHCSLGSGGCELIRLKVGDTMKLTYGNGTTYAVKLARTYPLTTTLSSGSK
jgi:hypothetical protein